MTARQLVAGLSLGSGLIVLMGTWALLAVEPDVPPPPPPPPAAAKVATDRFRYTEGFYKALLVHDARAYGLGRFDPVTLLAPNRFQPEYRGRYELRPGGRPLETEHLVLRATVAKEWAAQGDQRFRTDHLILRITNRGESPLAYFVGTALDDERACARKGNLAHDALTIRAGETIERVECFHRSGNSLRALRVDTMEISQLGYFYVARLDPLALGVAPRIAEAHRVPGGAERCRHVPQGELDRAGVPESRWAHVVDFYSRHNCDEYWFFADYRLAERPLAALVPSRAADE